MNITPKISIFDINLDEIEELSPIQDLTPRIPIFHSDLDDIMSNALTYTLDFYFKNKFYISDNRDEEIFIYSDDSEKNKSLFSRYQLQHPNRPVICLSKSIKKDPTQTNVIFVHSPISVHKIKDALNIAESQINPSRMETITTKSISTNNRSASKHKIISKLGNEIIGIDSPKFRATRKDIDLDDKQALSELVYSKDDYLQGKLNELFKKTEVTSLNTPYGHITYHPKEHKIFTALTSSTVQTFSSIPCNRKGDFIDGGACYSKDDDCSSIDGNMKLSKICANSLLWEVAVYSSRGRLPLSSNIDTPFTIKHWPNFTRLMVIPHSMEILSLWATDPISLRETLEVSKIAQRYVFSLYSAMHSINLIELKDLNNNANTLIAQEHEEESVFIKHKGFIGKLLGHISPDNNKKEKLEEAL